MVDAPGKELGDWRLVEEIATGGNAVVWRVERISDGVEGALKALKVQKVEREPYQRFVREVGFLRSQDDKCGILPIIDSNLPEEPSSTDRPWLVMPVATTIESAVHGQSLEVVVQAIETIAATLVRLKTTFRVAHRDIKPSNLYQLEDQWLVGDFGLIATPGPSDLTREGRSMGPAHFAPYELTIDAAKCDPFAVDVYSLGKTLWVLATGVNYAPDGHQPSTNSGFLIADFSLHTRAAGLDNLVDRMTNLQPTDRPSMEQVVQELASWLSMSDVEITFDAGDYKRKLAAKIGPALTDRNRLEKNKELAVKTFRQLQTLIGPLSAQIVDIYEHTILNNYGDKVADHYLSSPKGLGLKYPVWSDRRCLYVQPIEGPQALTLRVAYGIELFDDGQITFHGMTHVAPSQVLGLVHHWDLEPMHSLVGSLTAESQMAVVVQELAKQLPIALQAFIDAQPNL